MKPIMLLEVEKESTNNVVIGKPNERTSVLSRYGKIMGFISIIAGLLALLFSIAPYCIVWSAFVFWVLYPLSAVSVVSSCFGYLGHQLWRPTLGIILSLCSVIIASLSGEVYALGMAGSVNEMTHTAKIFIDALKWPF